MFAAVPSWLDNLWNGIAHLAADLGEADWLLTAIWLVLLAILLIPILLFVARGWLHRRADILSSISPKAAVLYLRNFQATDQRARKAFDELLRSVPGWDQVRPHVESLGRLHEAETRLRQLRQ